MCGLEVIPYTPASLEGQNSQPLHDMKPLHDDTQNMFLSPRFSSPLHYKTGGICLINFRLNAIASPTLLDELYSEHFENRFKLLSN